MEPVEYFLSTAQVLVVSPQVFIDICGRDGGLPGYILTNDHIPFLNLITFGSNAKNIQIIHYTNNPE